MCPTPAPTTGQPDTEDEMPEPWIKVSVAMLTHPKMVALPDDTHRYGWVRALAEAKVSATPGRFTSRAHLEEHVGRFAACIPAWIEAGLLEPDGDALVVHGWAEHQRDPTNAERQARYRNAHRNGDSNGPSRALSPSPSQDDVDVASRDAAGARSGQEPDPVAWLARHVWHPSYGMQARVERLVEAIGAGAVMERLEALQAAGDMPPADVNAWVFALTDRFRRPLAPLVEQQRPPDPRQAVMEYRRAVIAAGVTDEQQQALIKAGGLMGITDEQWESIFPEAHRA